MGSVPHMSRQHCRVIENILLAEQRRRGHLSIFEYGSGGSTVYFTQLLKTNFVWISVETSPHWGLKTSDEVMGLPVFVKILNYDVPPESNGDESTYQDYLKLTAMDEYVKLPKATGLKFDIFLIDGRKRARCIEVAKSCLKSQGLIFLHDAEREYYHDACKDLRVKNYRDSKGSELWLMSKK